MKREVEGGIIPYFPGKVTKKKKMNIIFNNPTNRATFINVS
jgi:hypothetical protein